MAPESPMYLHAVQPSRPSESRQPVSPATSLTVPVVGSLRSTESPVRGGVDEENLSNQLMYNAVPSGEMAIPRASRIRSARAQPCSPVTVRQPEAPSSWASTPVPGSRDNASTPPPPMV